jgi:hypothetical protein
VIDRPAYRDRLTVTVEFNGDLEAAMPQIKEKILAIPEVQSSLDNDLMEPLVMNIVPVRSEFIPTKLTLVDNRKQYDH